MTTSGYRGTHPHSKTRGSNGFSRAPLEHLARWRLRSHRTSLSISASGPCDYGHLLLCSGKTQNRLARECPKAAIQRDGSFGGSFGPIWRRPMVDDEILAGSELIGVWYGGVPVDTA